MKGRPGGMLALGLLIVSGALSSGWATKANAQPTTQTFRQLIRDGQRLSSAGNLRGASAKYAAAAKAATNDQELAEALTMHAVVQRNLGRIDQAEEDLRQAVALPHAGAFRRSAMFQLASLLEEQGRFDETIRLYRNIAAGFREHPEEAAEALLAAARLLIEKGQVRQAREVLGELPTDRLPQHLKSEAAALRLEADLGAGDVAGATRAINEAAVAGTQLSQLYVRLSRVLLGQGRLDEAARAAQSAIEADPGNSAAWRIQYETALADGTADALRADVEAKLLADPSNQLLVQQLASYAEWDPDPRRGLSILRSLTELYPQDANLLGRAGACAAQAGEMETALTFYRAALAVEPQDFGLYYRVGEVLAKMGKRKEAAEAFKRGTHHRPGDIESTRQLGTILLRAGLHDEAVAEYQDLRRLAGDDAALAFEMAEALAFVRPEDALAEYVRAASVRLDDADVAASEAIELARNTALLPRLAELAYQAGVEERSPGAIFLFAATQAAQGQGTAAVAEAVRMGLSTDGLLLLGERLESEGEKEAAATAYAAVAERDGVASRLRIETGVRAAEIFIAAGRTESARRVLHTLKGIEAGPSPLADRAAFLLADLDLAAGHELSTVEATLVSLTRESADPDLRWRARWRLADVLFARGEFAEAQDRYAELAGEVPPDVVTLPPLPPALSGLQLRLPLSTVVLNEPPPQQDPRTGPAYAAFQIAECAFRRGEFERAEALFGQVAETYPDSLYANDALERRLFITTHFSSPRPTTQAYLEAMIEGTRGGWEAALEKLRWIAASGGGEPLADDALMLCGALLEVHDRAEEAAREYRTLLDRFPDSLLAPEALLRAARLAHATGNDGQAREDLATLLKHYPHGPMAKTAALWLDDLDHNRPWP